MHRLSFVLAVFALQASVPAIAQDAPAAPIDDRLDMPIRAVAPRVTEADLGRAYDATFTPLRGGSLAPDAPRQASDVSEIEHGYRLLQEGDELQANARAWSLGGSLRQSSERSFAYFRAMQIRRIVALPEDVTISARRSPNARFYLSAIYYGFLYEMRFIGSSEVLGGGLSAIFPLGAADVSARRARAGVEFEAHGVGLTPVDGQAIFARTDSAIEQHYRTEGDPRPILVEYRRIPGTTPAGPERLTVRLTRIEFARRGWDAGTEYAAPEISAVVFRGARRVFAARGREDSYEMILAGPRSVVLTGGVVSRDQPLEFRFFDVDVASDDEAGRTFVSSLQPSPTEQEFTAGRNVRFWLEATLASGAPPTSAQGPVVPSVPPPAAAPPPVAPTPQCSPTSQVAATLIVQNLCRAPVEIEWVGFDCQPRQYRVLAPGARYQQQTFAGHVWRATAGGRVLRTVLAGTGPMIVTCAP
ncbi:MAG: hypothetical protein IT379_39270 [Deltaproteobacteria bacterium]|nr:hypothetical protein [Deltaproteobacteria bacterium]